MHRDENNVTHLSVKVERCKETKCSVCERPIKYDKDSEAPPTCKDCVYTLIRALNDPAAEAAVCVLAQNSRFDIETTEVNVRYGDEGPDSWTRETVEVTDKIRRLARELQLTHLIQN